MQQAPVAAAASAQQPQPQQPQPQQPQQQQQQTGNSASRPVTQPTQPAPQIRAQSAVPQVNISQQQRMPTPMSAAAAARMSPQQMLQVQAAQAQARANAITAVTQSQAQVHAQLQAQVQVQAQAQGTPQAALSSLPTGAHFSPPYHSRAATSSPGIGVAQQASPPRTAVTPSNAGVAASPRPPSAQPQPPMASPQIAGNTIPRPANNIAAHYLPVVPPGPHFTQEQMDQAIRLMQVRFLVCGSRVKRFLLTHGLGLTWCSGRRWRRHSKEGSTLHRASCTCRRWAIECIFMLIFFFLSRIPHISSSFTNHRV